MKWFFLLALGLFVASSYYATQIVPNMRWPHQGQSRKTCPALSGKQSIPTHGYAATRETAMAAFAKSWRWEGRS
jgi:hypothetical protein